MQLSVNNSNISNGMSVARLQLGNNMITNSISIGNTSVAASAANIGSVSVSPSTISTPSLIVGGTTFNGGFYRSIVDFRQFTGQDSEWFNPYYNYSYDYVQGKLNYKWYTQSTVVNANTADNLDNYFTTYASGFTVTYGGGGSHNDNIYWDSTNKPSYLPSTQYSWMVQGWLYAPETGIYEFGVDSDDAADVVVDTTYVAYWYGGHGMEGNWTAGTGQVSGSIYLTAGNYYNFRARMQQGGGGDGIHVGWKKPSDTLIDTIPKEYFYTIDRTFTPNPLYTGNETALVMMWAGGGGGVVRSGYSAGGGGGASHVFTAPLNKLTEIYEIAVGQGGVGTSSNGAAGDGGYTRFMDWPNTYLPIFGGAGAISTNTINGTGGGGGGLYSIGLNNPNVGGKPLQGNATIAESTYGGGGASGTGRSVFGGGSGGASIPGPSIYGGAGGVGGNNPVGTSVFGGNGGNSSVVATVPGGGGGGGSGGANTVVLDGARGEVRIWVLGPG